MKIEKNTGLVENMDLAENKDSMGIEACIIRVRRSMSSLRWKLCSGRVGIGCIMACPAVLTAVRSMC